ncbi:MAG TPA: hypothetical protein PLH57_03410 [Oligoflexia bacterium]|nr:hypothetical protein [Oligoflexia bacterium]
MGIKISLGPRQTVVPAGEYLAKLVEIKEGTFVGQRKTFEFLFEIASGEHSGIIVRGFVNANYETFSEYTKLRQWATMVARFDTDMGAKLDLDIFFGKILKVKVETKVSKKTKNLFSNVTAILGLEYEL